MTFSAIKRAIIIDDDVLISLSLETALCELGIEAITVNDASQLAKAMKDFDPQLLLLDIRLKTSDAYAILKLNIDPAFGGVISIVSGCDLELLLDITSLGERRGFRMGPPVPKPFTNTDLVEIVQAANQLWERGRISSEAKARENSEAEESHLTLRQALQEDRLEIWYQPKLDLHSGNLGGAEALVRGRSKKGNVISPYMLFLGASGQDLLDLTEYVIRKSIEHIEILKNAGFTKRLSINVPMSFLRQRDPAFLVRNAAMKPDWPGMIFEITEDEALSNPAEVRDAVMQLNLYAIDISIDDFGAGYSSLARLRDLPFKELKLDGSFVQGCAYDSMKYSICRSVLSLGAELGCRTVAEGVENSDDLAACLELGCDVVQGFYYSRPIPFDDFIQFVKDDGTAPRLIAGQDTAVLVN